MTKRKVEFFTTGCHQCSEVLEQINQNSCSDCEIVIHELNDHDKDSEAQQKAKKYGIKSVPAVVIDGESEGCCKCGCK